MNAIARSLAMSTAIGALVAERAAFARKIEEIDTAISVLKALTGTDETISISTGEAPAAVAATPAKPVNRIGRRFTQVPELNPTAVAGLPETHPAIIEARSLFPSSVVSAAQTDRVLVSGANNRKLGDRIIKGAWAGMPIYHLTLEERATCPKTCFNWRTCYGNGMPRARRHKADKDLTDALLVELSALQRSHPNGFAVRLHTLGDFYSTEYVHFWRNALERFSGLHVFGYTAWPRSTEIGRAVEILSATRWDRFAIRFSGKEPEPIGATTIFRMPEGPVVKEGIVCPAELGKTEACGTCGLCWAEPARNKCIVFVAHGPAFKQEGGAGELKAPSSRDVRRATREQQILDAIRALNGKEQVTGVAIALRSGLPQLTVNTYLKDMQAKRMVDHTGHRRSTSWFVVGEQQAAAQAIAKPVRPPAPVAPQRPPQTVGNVPVRRFEQGTTASIAIRTLEQAGYGRIEPYMEKQVQKYRVRGKLLTTGELLAQADVVRATRGLEPLSRRA